MPGGSYDINVTVKGGATGSGGGGSGSPPGTIAPPVKEISRFYDRLSRSMEAAQREISRAQFASIRDAAAGEKLLLKEKTRHVNELLAFEKEATAAQRDFAKSSALLDKEIGPIGSKMSDLESGGGKGGGKSAGSSMQFIGGRMAGLVSKTLGSAFQAALGATPAIAAILVIAEVLKTAMAPALKMIGAILKVLGAIFLPIGMIVMSLLRPALMLLIPILKFLMMIWKPHMMRIAAAAQTLSGKLKAATDPEQKVDALVEYFGVVFKEVVSFIGELFSKMLTTGFESALRGFIEASRLLVQGVVKPVGGYDPNTGQITTPLPAPDEELPPEPIILGLPPGFQETWASMMAKGAQTFYDTVFGYKRPNPWKLVGVGGQDEIASGLGPVKPGWQTQQEGLAEASKMAWQALNFGDNSFTPKVTSATGIVSAVNTQLTLLTGKGITPAYNAFIGPDGFIMAVASAALAARRAADRFDAANPRAPPSGGSQADIRNDWAARGGYTR